ncbi:MAG: hypothetical protein COX57_13240 [Alphaproteobacteria bacterium CG_4_10_14_0_2_um_filter_63_37]|nr:MAG: hypothetical protein AUJ55_04350 [Proteobacteria bacterium CG1_02_64_396]PJA23545.1 MAG: hypothetical protein COX57_13240 [Alphaproteobacteria bacterium CG_4_10_14_0_2_um_filter_63_37]
MTPFETHFRGTFSCLLRWDDVPAVTAALAAEDGWFWVDPAGRTIEGPLSGAEAQAKMGPLLEAIRAADPGRCGMVYVDDRSAPRMLKLFHPRKVGSSCTINLGPVAPWHLFTRIEPEILDEWRPPASLPEKKGLFDRVLGR